VRLTGDESFKVMHTPDPSIAVVVGASGGIGAAIVDRLSARADTTHIVALSRHPPPPATTRVTTGFIDVTDEDSIAAAVDRARALGAVRRVIVATGLLHEGPDFQPEKRWEHLTADAMSRAFAVNTTGPALVAKHFLPLLPRAGRSVFAALSARVGSISDNRLGGWYAYRASKAALNMLLQTFAIELARRAPMAICIGLHPGTVDTPLSQPFQHGLAAGQLFTPALSAEYLLGVMERLTPSDSGGVFAWDGTRIPA
jgi:NAD(P)-dependent dehydrogenase (short-subunit alcohol dehydrogenase family)